MHLYSALMCIVVHPKCFTIMWGGGSPQPPPVVTPLIRIYTTLYTVKQDKSLSKFWRTCFRFMQQKVEKTHKSAEAGRLNLSTFLFFLQCSVKKVVNIIRVQ